MNTKSIKNFMKTHSQNVMKKVVVCLTISLVLMMSSFSVAFADSTFVTLPYVDSAETDLLTNGLRLYTHNYSDVGYYGASVDTVFFYYPNGSNHNLVLLSLTQGTVYNSYHGGQTYSGFNADAGYYSKEVSNVGALNKLLYPNLVFPTRADGVSASLSFLNAQLTPPAKSYYTLQNGWLSVIDLGSSGANYEFDLATSFQMNSGLLSDTWGNGTTQRYWFSDSLPDENTSYLSTFGNAIDWEKGYPRNVFGQTKNATCTISGTSAGRYLYILNPALQQIADDQSPSINNQSMIISGLTEGVSAKIYKLSATATLDGINNAVDITSVGTVSATDTSSDLTNGFINADDETVVQNAGGGNENEVAQSVNGYLQGIQNALDNFVNQFIGLLSAPISHIQQMIESGSNFFSVFGQLFTWLPEEISVIITGSLLVMVIIGVFKMFL